MQMKSLARLGLMGLLLLGTASCGRVPGANALFGPEEATGEEQAVGSAEALYLEAERDLENGNADDAAEQFEEVERLYPYSEWSRRAMINQAFAWHEARDYERSRSAAERFISFYPADKDAAYAQYLIALSYYDQIADTGRDQGNTFLALQSLRDVIELYPDSDYAKSALLKFDLTLDHLAGKEMQIGRFYLKRQHYPAAINRFRAVVEEYQTTSHTAEALHRLVESYLSLGLDGEAQTAAAILGHNFPGSIWYQDSYALLTGRGLRPEAKSQGWLDDVWRQVVQGKWL
ncbi:outer membrane protein assembly factor BamD [Paracoccaceae bacterium GXU_MW_L88]